MLIARVRSQIVRGRAETLWHDMHHEMSVAVHILAQQAADTTTRPPLQFAVLVCLDTLLFERSMNTESRRYCKAKCDVLEGLIDCTLKLAAAHDFLGSSKAAQYHICSVALKLLSVLCDHDQAAQDAAAHRGATIVAVALRDVSSVFQQHPDSSAQDHGQDVNQHSKLLLDNLSYFFNKDVARLRVSNDHSDRAAWLELAGLQCVPDGGFEPAPRTSVGEFVLTQVDAAMQDDSAFDWKTLFPVQVRNCLAFAVKQLAAAGCPYTSNTLVHDWLGITLVQVMAGKTFQRFVEDWTDGFKTGLAKNACAVASKICTTVAELDVAHDCARLIAGEVRTRGAVAVAVELARSRSWFRQGNAGKELDAVEGLLDAAFAVPRVPASCKAAHRWRVCVMCLERGQGDCFQPIPALSRYLVIGDSSSQGSGQVVGATAKNACDMCSDCASWVTAMDDKFIKAFLAFRLYLDDDSKDEDSSKSGSDSGSDGASDSDSDSGRDSDSDSDSEIGLEEHARNMHIFFVSVCFRGLVCRNRHWASNVLDIDDFKRIRLLRHCITGTRWLALQGGSSLSQLKDFPVYIHRQPRAQPPSQPHFGGSSRGRGSRSRGSDIDGLVAVVRYPRFAVACQLDCTRGDGHSQWTNAGWVPVVEPEVVEYLWRQLGTEARGP